jgi:hypothetical protein
MTQEDERQLNYIDRRIGKLTVELRVHGVSIGTENHADMIIELGIKKDFILKKYGLDKKSLLNK